MVSLEEAVKLLINIAPKVECNAYFVKENCREAEDGLTSDESASIMLYTYESMPQEHSPYVILTATRRLEHRQEMKTWFLYLRLILTTFARLPSRTRSVHRGVREDLRKQYPIDTSIICGGISSWVCYHFPQFWFPKSIPKQFSHL